MIIKNMNQMKVAGKLEREGEAEVAEKCKEKFSQATFVFSDETRYCESVNTLHI